jgi:hypothetical protein
MFQEVKRLLSTFKTWYNEHRAWNSDHLASWPSASALDPDGKSAFLRKCDTLLTHTITNRGLAIEDRVEVSADHPYVSFAVPALDMTVWIYSNQVELATLSGQTLMMQEEWDTRTPNEMCRLASEYALKRPISAKYGAT